MRLRRQTRISEPAYPSRAQIGKLICVGLAAAGAGAPAIAGDETLRLRGSIVPGAPPAPTTQTLPEDAVLTTIAAHAARLGDADSRVREQASKALIALGIRCELREGQSVFPYKPAVLDAMQRRFTDPDPEVAQRARDVVRGIEDATALPPEPPPEPRLLGEIAVAE